MAQKKEKEQSLLQGHLPNGLKAIDTAEGLNNAMTVRYCHKYDEGFILAVDQDSALKNIIRKAEEERAIQLRKAVKPDRIGDIGDTVGYANAMIDWLNTTDLEQELNDMNLKPQKKFPMPTTNMKYRKSKLSTTIESIYGKDYQSHIKVGDEYWYWFGNSYKEFSVTGKHWHKVVVTYIRCGCVFYKLPDVPEISENFCPLDSYKASMFEVTELDPIKENLFNDVEKAKKLYYFEDQHHTIIHNWPNEHEVEVSPDDKSYTELFLWHKYYNGGD